MCKRKKEKILHIFSQCTHLSTVADAHASLPAILPPTLLPNEADPPRPTRP